MLDALTVTYGAQENNSDGGKMTDLLKHLGLLVRNAGGRAFLVGGAVRDELLGLEAKDKDVEVFGLTVVDLEKVLMVFSEQTGLKLSKVGKSFQVFKVGEFDVSLPRRDRKVGAGHTGFVVEADPSMTLKEAASRRDFTVNALMRDLSNGEIVDPFGGQMDMKFRVLRAVDPRVFEEDPLRVLRGLQFAARFEFEIDPLTLRLMAVPDLTELPAERLFVEFEKLLLKAARPSVGLRNVLKLVNFKRAFPMIAELVGNPEDPVWHGEPDTFTHTMLALDEAAKLVKGFGLPRAEALTVMLAVLCHDFGKPETTACDAGRCSAHGHAKAGLKPTTEFLDLLDAHTVDGFDVRKTVLALVEHHLFPAQIMTENKKTGDTSLLAKPLRRMAQKVRLDLLSFVSLADLWGRKTSDEVKAQNRKDIGLFRANAILFDVDSEPLQPILMGRHLLDMGFTPGPQMGAVLKQVFEAQLDGVVETLEQAQAMADDLREREG